jgi:hypothetical protein
MAVLGIAFLAYTRPLVRWLAFMNLRQWRDNKPFWIPAPSQSRIRWLEAARANPDRAPEMMVLMRAMGAICVVFAAGFIAGGIAILI